VICATHFAISIEGCVISFRTPMGLVRATPPTLHAVPEFASMNEVARQQGVLSGRCRELAEEGFGKDRDIPKGSPVRPADRHGFGNSFGRLSDRLLYP
jgi:hypothetical protein